MAEVSVLTIARLEAKLGRIGGRIDTATKIVLALESAGIEFVSDSARGMGVLLRSKDNR